MNDKAAFDRALLNFSLQTFMTAEFFACELEKAENSVSDVLDREMIHNHLKSLEAISRYANRISTSLIMHAEYLTQEERDNLMGTSFLDNFLKTYGNTE